jgi:hypothetical protein
MRAKPGSGAEAEVPRKHIDDFTPAFPFPGKMIDPTEAAKRDTKSVMDKYRKEIEAAVEKALKR